MNLTSAASAKEAEENSQPNQSFNKEKKEGTQSHSLDPLS